MTGYVLRDIIRRQGRRALLRARQGANMGHELTGMERRALERLEQRAEELRNMTEMTTAEYRDWTLRQMKEHAWQAWIEREAAERGWTCPGCL